MLNRLHIRDFAVVSAAELALQAGMTVISGETGAGKSLLVDALMLLTGARADAGVVRHGAERAELSAEFGLGDAPAAAQWLCDEELDDDAACQLRRVIRADGGSRAWINGRSATLSQLSELGALLVEIHGQHEHQALLLRARQLELLDAFGGHGELLDAVRQHASQWRALQRQLAAQGSVEDVEARLEWLNHQLMQFANEALEPSDIKDLIDSHRRQAHAAQLLEGSGRALGRLSGDEGSNLDTMLAEVRGELQRMAEHDPRYSQAAALIDTAAVELAEAGTLIQRARDALDLDPDRLGRLEQQLSRLHDLARKHRVPLEQLASVRDTLQAEHDNLIDAGGAAARLQQALESAAAQWRTAAAALSERRQSTAAMFGAAVSILIDELGMGGGQLQVELTPLPSAEPSPHGAEQVEFLVSANPGQPPRALRKVASGGELSRISLAIEVAAMGMDSVPTMVFDEVDSGIGGAIAEVVGQKLRALGGERQVLCVTHLPQVAAQGHHHFRVSKDVSTGSTHSELVALGVQDRIEELARMLGGVEISKETRAHARQMLRDGNGE
ncbi:MAG: DNA repair protein RecN, partial [Lysobacteraceae bacterium]